MKDARMASVKVAVSLLLMLQGLIFFSCQESPFCAEETSESFEDVSEEDSPDKLDEPDNSCDTTLSIDLTLIAHAMGGIEGYDYTNCKEAFALHNKHTGGTFTWFECDVRLSSDGIPILYHDINRFNGMTGNAFTELSYSDFIASKIYGEYTPADLNFVFEQMLLYDDIFFDLDITENHEQILTWVRDESVLASASDEQKESVYSRLIVEFYYEDDYLASSSILQGIQFSYTSEVSGVEDDTVLAFCEQNQIPFSSIRLSWCSEEIAADYAEHGIALFVYTVDEEEDLIALNTRGGVFAIYTNVVFGVE